MIEYSGECVFACSPIWLAVVLLFTNALCVTKATQREETFEEQVKALSNQLKEVRTIPRNNQRTRSNLGSVLLHSLLHVSSAANLLSYKYSTLLVAQLCALTAGYYVTTIFEPDSYFQILSKLLNTFTFSWSVESRYYYL